MTTLTPDPADGLSGDAYLSEHVEQKGYTPSELQTPGCYALRLSIPDTTNIEAYERLFAEHYENVPGYVDGLADAPRCYYVGAAKNIYERLEDHVSGDVRQAVLPTVFEVHSLKTVWKMESMDEAIQREGKCALLLGQADPEAFVHYR
jgi:predicted GIY-YIG superfamily endonuclease